MYLIFEGFLVAVCSWYPSVQHSFQTAAVMFVAAYFFVCKQKNKCLSSIVQVYKQKYVWGICHVDFILHTQTLCSDYMCYRSLCVLDCLCVHVHMYVCLTDAPAHPIVILSQKGMKSDVRSMAAQVLQCWLLTHVWSALYNGGSAQVSFVEMTVAQQLKRLVAHSNKGLKINDN